MTEADPYELAADTCIASAAQLRRAEELGLILPAATRAANYGMLPRLTQILGAVQP